MDEMTLKAILNSGEWETLPDTITIDKADAYPGDGETRRLAVESVSGWSLEDVSGLRQTLDERKEREGKAKAELDSLRKRINGLDIDKARDALNRPSTTEEVSTYIEQARKEWESEHNGKLETAEKQAGSWRQQLEQLMVDAEAMRLLGDKDSGVSGKFSLLRSPIRERVRVVEDEDSGKLALQVMRPDGKPMYASRGDTVAPAGMQDLLKALKDDADYTAAFNGTGASGGGNRGSGRSMSGESVDMSLDPTERLARMYEAEATGGTGQ